MKQQRPHFNPMPANDDGRGSPRTVTIANFIDRETSRTGRAPTIAEIARTFAMSQDRVEHHFRILGLL